MCHAAAAAGLAEVRALPLACRPPERYIGYCVFHTRSIFLTVMCKAVRKATYYLQYDEIEVYAAPSSLLRVGVARRRLQKTKTNQLLIGIPTRNSQKYFSDATQDAERRYMVTYMHDAVREDHTLRVHSCSLGRSRGHCG